MATGGDKRIDEKERKCTCWESSGWGKKKRGHITCPYCGAHMHYSVNIAYETYERDWKCFQCYLGLEERGELPKEETWMRQRKSYRKNLKEKIDILAEDLREYTRRYEMYGRFMRGKEKTRLLAENLER